MAKGLTRVLEWVIVIYFATHIPITILFDSQMIMPAWLYPQVLSDLLRDYCLYMKDAVNALPSVHPWFQSFVWGECILQLPFFFVGVYAFYKGSCKWVRMPAILYSTHTITTLQAILFQIFLHDFTDSPHPGPASLEERMKLAAVYMPYLVVPVIILLLMLFSKEYNPSTELPKTSGTTRSKKHKTR